eukprot:gnl/TRDRNA2_/TRDRNA2_171212_c0_seq1.p1 gnl/TRDRNA2_/TRDRNA2_171212_c0~~gnl/TRDRNA2_/TRDRNA2_171212_c0_seq1.p1  ORF type:complete len:853 (+),score=143.09 gnl/TRDRNA2_/TRDRNA2_171212_c0_seq1:44-2560(+)
MATGGGLSEDILSSLSSRAGLAHAFCKPTSGAADPAAACAAVESLKSGAASDAEMPEAGAKRAAVREAILQAFGPGPTIAEPPRLRAEATASRGRRPSSGDTAEPKRRVRRRTSSASAASASPAQSAASAAESEQSGPAAVPMETNEAKTQDCAAGGLGDSEVAGKMSTEDSPPAHVWVSLALAAALPLIDGVLPRDEHGMCVIPHPHALRKQTAKPSRRYITELGKIAYDTRKACDNCDTPISDQFYYSCAEGCEVDFCKKCHANLASLFAGLDAGHAEWIVRFAGRVSAHVLVTLKAPERRALARELAFEWPVEMFERIVRSFVDVADAQVVHVQDGENSDISKDVEFWHVVGMLQLLYEANQLPANECRFGEVAPRGPRIPHSRFSLGGIDKCDALAELERWRNANSLAVKLNVGEAVRESEQLKVDEGFATFLSHSNLVPVSFRQRCLQQDVRDSAPSKKGWRDRKIEVHREPKQLLPDVVKELGRQEQEKLLPRPLAVKFDGELGEGPGVNREFLRLAVQGILDGARASDEPLATLQDLEGLEQKEAALIWEYDSQLRTYWLQSSHAPPPESWSHKSLRTLGALLGHAILSGTLLPPVFPQVMYCLLLKDLGSPRSARPLTLGDLATVSPAMAKSLEKLLEYEGEDVGELFCLDWPRGNELTPMNRAEHVDAYVQWFFLERYAAQLQPLYKGFQAVVGLSPLLQNLVDSIQLEQILCGAELPIDVEAIRTGATEEGWKKDDKAYLESFWQVLLDLSDTERRSFLVFVSGCCRTPPRGWQDFALRIQRNGSGDDRLPTAYTCFNLLLLPKYTSVEVLRSRIRAAIKETEGFGLS